MKSKDGRPEWFKFWRRTCKQLDVDIMSLEDRGVVFTNMLRYFDGNCDLLPMGPVQEMAFNFLRVSIDESVDAYRERAEINRENGAKGGRPRKTERSEKSNSVFEKAKKPEDRSKKKEDRCNTEQAGDGIAPWLQNKMEG